MRSGPMSGDSSDEAAYLLGLARDLEERSSSEGKVTIAVETDLDEAFVLGTRSGLMKLAAALLRAAASDAEPRETGGVPCRWTTFTQRVADPLGQVVVGAECVVEDDVQRARLSAHFRRFAGDLG